MRRGRDGCAHSDTSSDVRPVNGISHAESKGHVGTLLQDPIYDAAFIGFRNNIRFADFCDRLVVGVISDPAVPINVRVDLGPSGAAGDQE